MDPILPEPQPVRFWGGGAGRAPGGKSQAGPEAFSAFSAFTPRAELCSVRV